MFNAMEMAYMDEMVNFYGKTSFTHDYIFGFIDGDKLMGVFLSWEEIRRVFRYDKAATSKGGVLKIRVRANTMDKRVFLRKAFVVGCVRELTADSKHNKGENFERIITEKLCGKKWEKDSIPYTDAGDVIYNGKPYQVKFDGAELTNAKTYENIKAAG